MKTRLTKPMLGKGKSVSLYLDFIKPFSEIDYQNKNSDKLGSIVLKKLGVGIGETTAKDAGQQAKPIKGKIFELLIGEMLIMHRIVPFYAQAKMWKFPMSKIDFLLYNERAPVIFTCKVSLAERWRQAAFEGISMKNIYREGQCFLISANEQDVNNRNIDIKNNRIDGIDECFMANSTEFKKKLIYLSKNREFCCAPQINPIVDGKFIDPRINIKEQP